MLDFVKIKNITMVSELKKETTTLKLTLNAVDVEDFLAALRYLRFPVEVALPKLNGKKTPSQTVIQNAQPEPNEEEELWRKNQAKGQALLVEMAKIDSDSVPELSEDEIAKLINSEIKAYRAEKRQQKVEQDTLNNPVWLEKQANIRRLMLQLAQSEAKIDLSNDDMTDLINSEIKAFHAEQTYL